MTRDVSDGDVQRLERFFRQEVDRVYSYARARLGNDEAEEVVGDVFQAVAVAARDGNWSVLTPSWVMTVTRNKVIDRWRRAQRRKVRDQLLLARNRDDVVLRDRWTDPGHREDVLATLDQLPQTQRAVLILHYVDGMPVADVAEHLGCSNSAAESMLARARRSFRRLYQVRGEEL